MGLAAEQDGVQLMKPIDTLDDLLERANRHKIFGTKMRSVINDAAEAGITAIVDQQFDYASRISAAGLVPIIEPEVSISSPHKEQAEMLLCDAIAKHVEALPADARVMIKITIPTQVGLYGELASDPRVLRIVALSGGYSRDEACALLERDPTLIASFSRALLEGPDRGPDRRGVQRHARALGRGDLPGFGGQAACHLKGQPLPARLPRMVTRAASGETRTRSE